MLEEGNVKFQFLNDMTKLVKLVLLCTVIHMYQPRYCVIYLTLIEDVFNIIFISRSYKHKCP